LRVRTRGLLRPTCSFKITSQPHKKKNMTGSSQLARPHASKMF